MNEKELENRSYIGGYLILDRRSIIEGWTVNGKKVHPVGAFSSNSYFLEHIKTVFPKFRISVNKGNYQGVSVDALTGAVVDTLNRVACG